MMNAHTIKLDDHDNIDITIVPAYYRSKELLIRWMQYSAFADSVFRSHMGTLPKKSAQVYDRDVIPHWRKWVDVFVSGAEYRRGV